MLVFSPGGIAVMGRHGIDLDLEIQHFRLQYRALSQLRGYLEPPALQQDLHNAN